MGRLAAPQGASSSYMHHLSNGLRLEVLHQAADVADISRSTTAHAARPPLLFVHGAGHGAWCWQVRL